MINALWTVLLTLLFLLPSAPAEARIRSGETFPVAMLEKLEGLAGGSTVKVGSKATVVVFWASWCPYCRKLLAVLGKISKSYEAKGVKFIGVNKESSKAGAEAYAAKLPFASVYDAGESLANKVAITGVPVTIIMDGTGKVLASVLGFSPTADVKVSAVLDTLL